MFVSEDPLIRPQNPLLVLAVVVSGLGLVGLLACTAPAIRAARIPPTDALRDG
jgi:ABC-type lipoprotein release transport system permease subunit